MRKHAYTYHKHAYKYVQTCIDICTNIYAHFFLYCFFSLGIHLKNLLILLLLKTERSKPQHLNAGLPLESKDTGQARQAASEKQHGDVHTRH